MKVTVKLPNPKGEDEIDVIQVLIARDLLKPLKKDS